MITLTSRDVKTSCKNKLVGNEHDCAGFLRSVADDLMVFLPGASRDANGQVSFMKQIAGTPGIFSSLGEGPAGEQRAIDACAGGNFVVCGLTASELNQEASRIKEKKAVTHGHVAIVVGGRSVQGWPIAWWGQLHGTPGRGESLSKCFRPGDRKAIHYFEYRL